jgi:saccharopine dehydrogenase-like NADP-dependent oxidoreductase
MHTILVLGGYGFFGSRICAALSKEPGVRVLVGGRHGDLAWNAAASFGLGPEAAVELDAKAPGLAHRFTELGVNSVVHTAGPFQGQDYTVALAAIAAGCHYVDLADGRQFVCGIGRLDAAARAKGLRIISGASSVPGLSSAVVERFRPQFTQMTSIGLGISSGARAPGLATVQGIFGYCGKPFRRLEGGTWVTTYGWMDLTRYQFPNPLGSRWLGSCDIPDLELFPQRYPSTKTVAFHAGFASDPGHLVVWGIAGLVRAKLLPSASGFAKPLNRLSRWLEPVVSDQGGMYVKIDGLDHDGREKTVSWHLLAAENHGPYIPCGASIALAMKLARGGEGLPVGAMPCVGLLSVEDYLAPLRELSIREVV